MTLLRKPLATEKGAVEAAIETRSAKDVKAQDDKSDQAEEAPEHQIYDDKVMRKHNLSDLKPEQTQLNKLTYQQMIRRRKITILRISQSLHKTCLKQPLATNNSNSG